MDVNHRDELLSAYADGELAGDEKDFVERLLQADPAADTVLREYLALRKTFAQFSAPSLGEDFTRGLMAKIAAKQIAAARPESVPGTSAVNAEPANAEPYAKSADAERSLTSLFDRLARPRVWIYPLASVVIVLLLIPVLSTDSLTPKRSTSPKADNELARNFSPEPDLPKAAEKTEPRVLSPEKRAERVTPPIPLSDRETSRDAQGNPIVLKIETVQVVLAGEKPIETLVSGFDTFLRRWCADHAVSEVTRCSASAEGNACFEIRVQGADLESLLAALSESGIIIGEAVPSEDVKRWLLDDRSSTRPVEFQLAVAEQ